MHNSKIIEIDKALKLQINYNGKSSGGRYLKRMDILVCCYQGAPGIKVSKLLDDYYKAVGVANLDEAMQRLKKLEK